MNINFKIMVFAAISIFTVIAYSNQTDTSLFDNSAQIIVYEMNKYKKTDSNSLIKKTGNEVLAKINERLNKYPDSAWLYIQRGWLYLSINEQNKAIDDFNKSINLYPSSSAYMGLGMAYSNLGKRDIANQFYMKSLNTKSVYPDNEDPWLKSQQQFNPNE